MGNTIYKNIKEYKKGNKEIFREIINVFNPLINKLSKSVNGEDTRQDLLVHLLEIINKLPEENKFEDDRIIFAYISKALKYEYIKLSKKNDKIKNSEVELNLEDVFEEAMYNEATLKEEFTSSVRLAVVRELKEKFKNELMREISNPISEKIEDIARESMNDLVENASEKKYRFRLDYMDEELTVDEFIRGRMKKVVDSNIETMVESKAKSFVNELRKRYDMAFAAFIVDNMRKQNMLKDEKIAELLKDNPDER